MIQGKSVSTVFQIVKAIFSFLRHGWQVRSIKPSNVVLATLRLGANLDQQLLNSSLKLGASHQQLLFFFGRFCYKKVARGKRARRASGGRAPIFSLLYNYGNSL